MGNLERRVAKIEAKVSPKEFLTIEDALRQIHLRVDKKNLTPEQKSELRRLETIEVHPDLKATFKKLHKSRMSENV
jgi:hypothetical protein